MEQRKIPRRGVIQNPFVGHKIYFCRCCDRDYPSVGSERTIELRKIARLGVVQNPFAGSKNLFCVVVTATIRVWDPKRFTEVGLRNGNSLIRTTELDMN